MGSFQTMLKILLTAAGVCCEQAVLPATTAKSTGDTQKGNGTIIAPVEVTLKAVVLKKTIMDTLVTAKHSFCEPQTAISVLAPPPIDDNFPSPPAVTIDPFNSHFLNSAPSSGLPGRSPLTSTPTHSPTAFTQKLFPVAVQPVEALKVQKPIRGTSRSKVVRRMRRNGQINGTTICKDKSQLCCFWAVAGECTRNPYWMRVNCAKSCGTCNCKMKEALKCKSTGVKCHLRTTSTSTTTTTTTPSTRAATPSTRRSTISRTVATTGHPSRRRTHFVSSATRTTATRSKLTYTTSTTTQRTTVRTTTSTTTTTTTTPENCFNYNPQCEFWAEIGECERNPLWVRPNCRKACNACDALNETIFVHTPRQGCLNEHKSCDYWSANGECETNPNWMQAHCRRSCRLC